MKLLIGYINIYLSKSLIFNFGYIIGGGRGFLFFILWFLIYFSRFWIVIGDNIL